MKTRRVVLLAVAVCVPLLILGVFVIDGWLKMERHSEAVCEAKAKNLAWVIQVARSDRHVILHSMQELADFVNANIDRQGNTPVADDYKCSCDISGDRFSYELVQPALDGSADEGATPVLREVHPNHCGKRVVVFGDGRATLVSEDSSR